MINSIFINKKDNVIVAIEKIFKGEEARYRDDDGREYEITVLSDIPVYHKIASVKIHKGENIIKYGEHIGKAIEDIEIGEHVHEHNVQGIREDLING